MSTVQRLAVAVSATLLLAGSLDAKTFVVEKGGKFPTIQSAVDAAGPGDRIEIEAGTYRENVFVLANRTGIEIEGKGKVILDALPSGGAGAGPGLQILAAGAKVEGLVIRNARRQGTNTDGIGLAGFGIDLRIEDVRVEQCEDGGIFLDVADGARVRDCRVVACRSGVEVHGDGVLVEDVDCERLHASAIVVEGDGARVKSCSVRNVGTFGIQVVGDDARVLDNQVVGSADEGVFVEGDDARIEKNDFRTVLDFAVFVNGDRAMVRKNDVRRNLRAAVRLQGVDHVFVDNALVDVDGDGVTIVGSGARVESNEISFTYGDSITVEGNGTVIGNELSDALDGYSAVQIESGAGGVVRDNEIARVTGSAVFVSDNTFGLTITGNVANECGDPDAPTYRIAGAGHLVADNVAKNGGNDGFRVTGMQHVLLGNRAIGNLADGIDLESGSLYEVRDNKALKNGGEGIENSANDVVVRDNVAKKNRIDLANDNPVNVTFEKNEFVTGGKNTKGELE